MIVAARTWTRFIALGDSVTEGWCDPVVGDGAPWFGWADRLALSLDADSRAAGGPRLEFANLAVRGRRVRHVVDEQAPAAREPQKHVRPLRTLTLKTEETALLVAQPRR